MDNNFKFARYVSIDHRSSAVASVRYSANLNLGQCYNLNLRRTPLEFEITVKRFNVTIIIIFQMLQSQLSRKLLD